MHYDLNNAYGSPKAASSSSIDLAVFNGFCLMITVCEENFNNYVCAWNQD